MTVLLVALKFFVFILLLGCDSPTVVNKKPANNTVQSSDTVKSQLSNSTNHLKEETKVTEEEESETTTITPATELLRKIEKRKIHVNFHGFGNEPFWDLYITDNELLYTVNGENSSYRLLNKFDKDVYSQTVRYRNNSGKEFSVKILKEPVTDESEQTYPYSVIWPGKDTYLNGAGESN